MRPFPFLMSFVLLLSAFVPTVVVGQSGGKGTVSGKVLDGEDQPLAFVSVALYQQNDSSLVGGSVTDGAGDFAVQAPAGVYFLRMNFLSFEERTVPDLDLKSGSSLHLGQLTMQEGALGLDEVKVSAERAEMELKLDKRVFNVAQDVRSVASNASEILDNLPSVAVDVEGNVSLRGSENVRILVDGKPSGLVGVGSGDGLRNLQGSMIERVEVITNPSARYDAEGEVGIINIVLKKEQQKGFNGSFTLNSGWPTRYGAAFQVNYRKNRLNLFSSFGFDYNENPGSGFSNQTFFQPDTLFSYARTREHLRTGYAGNLRMGADYSLSKRSTLTGTLRYSLGERLNTATLNYRDFNQQNELVQTVVRTDEEEEGQSDLEFNLLFRKTFAQKDREWTTDFRWERDFDNELSDLLEVSDQPLVADLIQRSENDENQEDFLFQSDYIHPLGPDGRFETGVKATFRNIENDFVVEQQASDGVWQPLDSFNNRFLYQENIYAAYVMYGNKVGRLSYQAGLRYEYSDISTELRVTNETNPRQYDGFFPSLHFSYETENGPTWQLSYSRRLTRPRFRLLLPFFTFSDPRNFFSGNPNLDPEYTNSYEAGALQYFEKGSILGSVYYRHRTDIFQRITLPDSLGNTRIFPINLGVEDVYGLELNGSYTPWEWWRINTSFNLFQSILVGSYEGRPLNADAFAWTSNGSSKWSINKKTELQVSYNYRARRRTTQGIRKALYAIDIGASREVFQGKGTLSFNLRDVLNSRVRLVITDQPDFYSENEFQWRARFFQISLNYRINQKKQRPSRPERSERGGPEGGF